MVRTARELARIPQGWSRVPYPIRDRDGVMREHVIVVPPAELVEHGPRPLGSIVRIGHGRDWSVGLAESPAHEALPRLWDRSLRQNEADLAAATAILRRQPSFVLSSRTQDEALALIEVLLK
jgi:hypothetical protein